ncbi:MAG: histidine--tRNA ligase [Syntrophomonadaceae bacterium]|jgi:histidyl-tRNA synthetase|nr:histidine--tRNA ligase [Syntrophomonadaceae bacterium]
MQIKAPRGTYDILPEQSIKWQWMEKIIKDTAGQFGYQEIRTPVFEHTELFERGVGETSDIVSKEMYTFQDKAGRSITLRPEATASCVRAFIEHGLYNGLLPVKWYYSGPMFRYDRPQTGRFRQFHQFGVEVFGSDNSLLDAEVIILMMEIFKGLGIKEPELHINSVGCPSCRPGHRQELIDYLTPLKDKLCKDCQQRYMTNPLRVLDCKNQSCHQTITGHPTIADSLCPACTRHYEQVREALSENGVAYIHDNNLVRGLDYYTNTAFEVHIPGLGAQSAIGGGGRYNGLVKECGGPDVPGIGFALGMERILLAMEASGRLIERSAALDVFIITMDDKFSRHALQLTNKIRQSGISADMDYNHRSPRAQMKFADKSNAKVVIMIGEEETEKGFYLVRNMQSREQYQIDQEDFIAKLQTILLKNEEEIG